MGRRELQEDRQGFLGASIEVFLAPGDIDSERICPSLPLAQRLFIWNLGGLPFVFCYYNRYTLWHCYLVFLLIIVLFLYKMFLRKQDKQDRCTLDSWYIRWLLTRKQDKGPSFYNGWLFDLNMLLWQLYNSYRMSTGPQNSPFFLFSLESEACYSSTASLCAESIKSCPNFNIQKAQKYNMTSFKSLLLHFQGWSLRSLATVRLLFSELGFSRSPYAERCLYLPLVAAEPQSSRKQWVARI